MFANDVTGVVQKIEIYVGIGLGLGPTIGSAVYTYLDYEGTMYLYCAFTVVALITCIAFIPDVLNSNYIEEEESNESILEEKKEHNKRKDVGWKEVLMNKHSNFAMMSCCFGMFAHLFVYGFLADELINLGLLPNQVGLVYGGESLVYFINCLIYPYTFEHWPRKSIFVLAFVGLSLCHLIQGPSAFLNFP